MNSLKQIALDYFEQNPDAKDDVMCATYAYHLHHFRDAPGAHNFEGPWRDCVCLWCGRSRVDVRWDDLPYQCQKIPAFVNESTQDVILREEQKCAELIQRAEKMVPNLIKKHGLTGESLCLFHHTHGFTLEIVGCIVDIPEDVEREYEKCMEVEQNRSRDAMVKKVITVKMT